MKKLLLLLAIGLAWPFIALGQDSYFLEGVVTDKKNQPVPNAYVRVANSFNEVVSDQNGAFRIAVDGEDTLVVDAMSMYRKEVAVDSRQSLTIALVPKYEELGEVEIRQKKKKYKEAGVVGGSKIRRALGYDGDRFRENFVDQNDFDVRTALAKIPGLQLRTDVGNKWLNSTGMLDYLMITRGRNTNPINIVVDDVLVPSATLQGMRPEIIENVLLADDASTPNITYASTFGGWPGHVGYLIIDTIYGRMGGWDEGPPSLLATGNTYSDDAKPLEALAEKPDYIVQLEQAQSFQEARSIRQQQLDAMAFTNLPYQLNTAAYFQKWDKEYASGILEEIYRQGKANPRVLLALAYHYEANGEPGKATYLYQDIITLLPDNIQSYRNLALIYAQSGKFELANTLYKKMLFNQVPRVDFTPLASIIRNEYQNFIAHHKSKIDFSGLPARMLQANFKKDSRMVFEWNNPFAEFELQMVSPEGKFFTWKHTQDDNSQLLRSEVDNGYAIKEFIIDDAQQGEWLVNINVLGADNESIPTYLKYTLYNNYGKGNETRRIKVVNLNTLKAKVTLDNVIQEEGQKTRAMRKQPESIVLYWDTSLGLMHRNLNKELRLLSEYFRALTSGGKTITTTLVLFGSDYKEQQQFSIDKNNFATLEAVLRSVSYHGPTDFSAVLGKEAINADAAFVFSDATSIYAMPEVKRNLPIFCINSLAGANHMILNDLAFYSGGFYVDLSRKSVAVGIQNLLQDVYVNADYASQKEMNRVNNLVYGVVHNDSGPIQGAIVSVAETFNQVTTGSNGMYRIVASEGDRLRVSAFGMKTKDTLVGREQKIHLKLKPAGELLEEVTVTTRKSENELVDTPFENRKKGSVGYSLSNRVTAKDIRADQIELWQIMQKMPGVVVVDPTSPNPRYKFRKTQTSSITGSTFPVIVLDGVLFDQDQQAPPFINTQQIESITLIKSMMATNRYGQLAAAGAIVIETNMAGSADEARAQATLDPVKGNDYTGGALTMAQVLTQESQPGYIRDIRNASDFASARAVYLNALSGQDELSIGFFAAAARAMTTHDPDYATVILYNISELAPNNEKALKTLAYYLEAMDKDSQATPVYERLVNLAPQKVQPYLDLARNYKEVGRYELSATLYRQMLANSIPKVDFSEVAETVFNELKQLVSLHKSRIDYQGLPPEFLKVGFKQDIRIVVEWNDPMADFDLQFVSPQKKYFQLSHSIFGDKAQIQKEIALGYSIMEFTIDDADAGQWMVNLDYNGDRDPLNPTVLKYTVYTDYGLKSQKKVVKTIKLQDLSSKVILDSFVY